MNNVSTNEGTQPGTGSRREKYELEFDEQGCAVYFTVDGEQCDEFFSFQTWDEDGDDYWLVNMFSPETGIGLGRDALQCFIDNTAGRIHVRDRWMTSSGDGSHVLPESWPFVERMMAEGLIVSHNEPELDGYEEEYFDEI